MKPQNSFGPSPRGEVIALRLAVAGLLIAAVTVLMPYIAGVVILLVGAR